MSTPKQFVIFITFLYFV